MSRQPRVAVVGAGLAGLTAGLALAKRGWHVDLYERSRLLGGKATSFEVEGQEVDCGQHVVLACCTATLDLVDELGLHDALYVQPRFEVTVLSRTRPPAHLRASSLPAPLHLMAGFARYPHLSTLDRLQVGRALMAARGDAHAKGDMAAWLRRRHQGTRALRAFWEPFLVPALNAPLDRVSAEMGLFVIRTAFLGDRDAARIAYLRVPLARLAEAAAARLDGVHLRQAVVGLHREGNRVTGVRLNGGAGAACDACVLAVPPRRLHSILEDAPEVRLDGLDAFEPMPIVDVHLWYDRPVLGCDFAALLDSPVQWVFEKSPGYVCCSMSAADDLIQRPEQSSSSSVAESSPPFSPSGEGALAAWGGHSRPRRDVHPRSGCAPPRPSTALSNLVIAGAWTDTGWPATIEFAVRSGSAAALTLFSNAAGWQTASGAVRRRRWLMQSEALRSAVDWLLEHQDSAGWWSGELETNVTMTAEHVLLLRFLGVSHDDIRDGAIRHILGTQRKDGTWALYYDGPGDLSTTIEAYVALRVLGVDAAQPQMRSALRMIVDQGGARRSARLHQDLACALRHLPVGRRAEHAARAGATSVVGAAQPLRLRLLGAGYGRTTAHRHLAPPGARPGCRCRRGDRSRRAPHASRSGPVPSSGSITLLKLYDRLPRQPGRAIRAHQACRVDHRTAGGGRWMGRHPTAMGLFTDRAESRRHVRRSPGDAARPRGLPSLQH